MAGRKPTHLRSLRRRLVYNGRSFLLGRDLGRPMNERTSATLLRRVGQRDDAAWSEFVELYTPLLFHWALKSNLQREDAAELVQEVFVSLLTLLPTFQYDK